MAAASTQRLKVLGIAMTAIDRMSPATKAAGKALRVFQKVAVTAFKIAGRAAAKVGRTIKRVLLGPIGILSAALGGIGALVIIRSFQRLAQQMDEVAKAARTIGADVESIQELGFVAELTGTSIELLLKSMQRTTRAVGEAARGTALFVDFFDELGLKVGNLINLRPADQFTIIAEALAGLENNTKRVTLAMDVFGARNVKILNLMNENAGAIRAARQEARDLGIVLDAETIKGFEDWIDAVARVKAALRGTRIVIATEFTPIVLDLLDALKETFVERREAVRVWARTMAANLKFAGQAVAAFAKLLRELAADQTRSQVFGEVLGEVAKLALSIVKETAVAAVKILKNVVDAIFRPLIEVVGLLGEQAAARFVSRFSNELKTLALIPLQIGAFVRDQLGETLTGALAVLQPGLLPFLSLRPEDVERAKASIRNAVDETAAVAESKIIDAEGILGAAVQKVIRVLGEEIDQSGQAISAAVAGISDAFSEFGAGLADIDDPAVKRFTDRMRELQLQLEAAKLAAEEASVAVRKFTMPTSGGVGFAPEATAEELIKIQELRERTNILLLQGAARVEAELVSSFKREVEARKRGIGTSMEAIEAFANWQIARQIQLQRDLNELQGGFAAGVSAALKDIMAALTDTFQTGADLVQQLFGAALSSVNTAIDDAIAGTFRFKEAWRDLGREVLTIIAKITAKLIAQKVVQSIFGFSSFARGGIVEHALQPIARLQAGGIVDRPTLATVGEGGQPEAIVPLPDGRSIPVTLSGSAAGDEIRDVKITFEIHAVDVRGFDQLLNESSGTIESLIQRAMASRRDFREQIRSIT